MTGLGLKGSESFRGSTTGSGGLGFFLIGFGLEDYYFKWISNLQVIMVSLYLRFQKEIMTGWVRNTGDICHVITYFSSTSILSTLVACR